MATKRDLVEAHSFSRRRLVTAFVSGAPGGREVEPARPGRTIVGGLALAVLLVAGAAVAGVLSGRDPADWRKAGLLVSKEKGGLYVILEENERPTLHSILNITSAQLILGADVRPTILSEDTIAGQRLGQDLGILGAPQQVPDPSRLVDSGWTACTGDRLGLAVGVGTGDTEPVRDAAFVVRSRGRHYVIAEGRPATGEPVRAHRYALPEGPTRDVVLGALDLPVGDQAAEVPEEWVRLFPDGGALDFATFRLEGYGGPAPGRGGKGLPADARVGEVIEVGGQRFLLTADGPAELDPFAAAVYQAVERPAGVDATPRPLDAMPRVEAAAPPFADAHWPDRLLGDVVGEHCAVLESAAGEVPVVRLASGSRDAASAEGLEPDERRVGIEPGHGAHVVAGDWDDTTSSSAYLLDAKGLAYPLVGAETAEHLGYGDHDPPLVPDSWVELFDAGVVLSREAALCPPTGEDQECA